jgi:outer membrane protein assembly factor BamB
MACQVRLGPGTLRPVGFELGLEGCAQLVQGGRSSVVSRGLAGQSSARSQSFAYAGPGGQYPSALDVAGDAACVGYLNSVQAFSARTGQELWSYPAEGQVTKLAASSGTLYAATGAPYPGYAPLTLRSGADDEPGMKAQLFPASRRTGVLSGRARPSFSRVALATTRR